MVRVSFIALALPALLLCGLGASGAVLLYPLLGPEASQAFGGGAALARPGRAATATRGARVTSAMA